MKRYGFLSFASGAKKRVWNALIFMPILMSGMLWLTISTAHAESIIVPFFDKSTGYEPWLTDLTPKGTHLLKDLKKGPVSSFGDGTDSNVISSFGYKYFFAGEVFTVVMELRNARKLKVTLRACLFRT